MVFDVVRPVAAASALLRIKHYLQFGFADNIVTISRILVHVGTSLRGKFQHPWVVGLFVGCLWGCVCTCSGIPDVVLSAEGTVCQEQRQQCVDEAV